MSDTRTAGPATQRHTQHKPIIEEPLHDTTTSRTGDVKKVMDEINVSTTPPHPEASPDRPGAVTVSRIVARNSGHPEPYTGTRTVLVCSSRPRGSAAAAGGRTPPRLSEPPPALEGTPMDPGPRETPPIILGRRLGALLRRWGAGRGPN